jgi:hypothetical protein
MITVKAGGALIAVKAHKITAPRLVRGGCDRGAPTICHLFDAESGLRIAD